MNELYLLFAPLWPFLIVSFPLFGIPLLLVSVLIYRVLKRRQPSQVRRAFWAYLLTTALLIVPYLLLMATGDITRSSEADSPGGAGSRLIYQIRSLKMGVLASLADGNELPLGAFALDSPFVLDDLVPYMETRLNLYAGETMIILSADADEKAVRSANAGTYPLYVGFYRHPALIGAPQPRKPGFFGKLFGIQTFTPAPGQSGVEAYLRNLRTESGLYKNAGGELYDGGYTVLMKVF